jgi:hypothetical protein
LQFVIKNCHSKNAALGVFKQMKPISKGKFVQNAQIRIFFYGCGIIDIKDY